MHSLLTQMFAHITGGSAAWRDNRQATGLALTHKEHRDLAEAMRRLPGHYAGRLPAATVDQVTAAAAAGRWEQALDQLIGSLFACTGPITTAEREHLKTLLTAMQMRDDRLDSLPDRRGQAAAEAP
jgi:thioredoxin-like negative regulator of GroEL